MQVSFYLPEGSHTENEVRLFNELQATKNELEAERQMNSKLQEEKEEIIAVMHQAAVSLHYFRDMSSYKS